MSSALQKLQIAASLAICFAWGAALAVGADGETRSPGVIVGKVTDPEGAPVANASVVAVNLETGDASDTRSDASGDFRLPELNRGTYELSVWRRGYRAFGGRAKVGEKTPVHVVIRLLRQ